MRPWGEGLWVGQWLAGLLPGVVRRVLEGGEPQPGWLPRRVVTVVSADVDTGAGVGAVWMVWRPKSGRARRYIELLEWYEDRWQLVGGSSSSPVDDPGAVDVIEFCGGAGALSLTRRLDPPRSIATAPYICCLGLRLGRDVGVVLVGDRRFEVPERRRLIAAWPAPHESLRVRPVVVALGHDGTELSRIGPHDGLDTYTWARLREEL